VIKKEKEIQSMKQTLSQVLAMFQSVKNFMLRLFVLLNVQLKFRLKCTRIDVVLSAVLSLGFFVYGWLLFFVTKNSEEGGESRERELLKVNQNMFNNSLNRMHRFY
jgi:hypothetical protein